MWNLVPWSHLKSLKENLKEGSIMFHQHFQRNPIPMLKPSCSPNRHPAKETARHIQPSEEVLIGNLNVSTPLPKTNLIIPPIQTYTSCIQVNPSEFKIYYIIIETHNMFLVRAEFLAVHAQEVAVGNVVANGLDDGT